MRIKSIEQLEALYAQPSFRAKHKVQFQLDKHSINFIENSPFVVISTSNSTHKMDASPRGGAPGFIKITENNEIVIPDAKGNNRMDSLRNIIETGHIGMLFLIPGVDETLRINGKAYLTNDASYLSFFAEEKTPLKLCIIVQIEEVYLHCAKAFMRSKLWNEDSKIECLSFPTMGEMLKDQLGSKEPPESREDMIKRYIKDL